MRALLKFGKGRYINTSKNQIDPGMDFPCVFEIFTLRVTVVSRQFLHVLESTVFIF